jgi:uridylate kinase
MVRVTGDQMGMLATGDHALAMQDAWRKLGAKARVMSAIKINDVCEDYIRCRAIRHLEKGRLVIFAPVPAIRFFTTDSGAALRRDRDRRRPAAQGRPRSTASMTRIRRQHQDACASTSSLRRGHCPQPAGDGHRAFALCRDSDQPTAIFDMGPARRPLRILRGEDIGTLVQGHA